jgi:hypothetical protein
VWVCITQCESGRAEWIAVWITSPAAFTGHSLGPTMFPSRSIFTRFDAVTSR